MVTYTQALTASGARSPGACVLNLFTRSRYFVLKNFFLTYLTKSRRMALLNLYVESLTFRLLRVMYWMGTTCLICNSCSTTFFTCGFTPEQLVSWSKTASVSCTGCRLCWYKSASKTRSVMRSMSRSWPAWNRGTAIPCVRPAFEVDSSTSSSMRRRSSAENSAPSSMPGGCWVPLLLVAAGVCDVSGCVYMCVCVYVCMYVCMYVCVY